MSNSLRNFMTAALASVLLVSTTAVLAEEESTQKNLNDFVCKDVMRLSGSERDNTLALAHGYRLGKMNTTTYEIEVLSDLTDRFIDHCLNNPNDKALAAFEKLGK